MLDVAYRRIVWPLPVQKQEFVMPTIDVGRRRPPAPLPPNSRELMARRIIRGLPNLNDVVEPILLSLYDNAGFRKLLSAVYDGDAEEGSCAADDFKAAEMLRDKAKSIDPNSLLSRAKLATIVKSMKVIQRRYGASRKQRRNSVGGVEVEIDEAQDAAE
ncbi:MAG: hypothetical protein EHM67_12695 [Hyphomicrobiaceae bacterium]|nr:MAG: hypothetical protein EHM67_12695 [Hyphomicrobiaceae bacterium]